MFLETQGCFAEVNPIVCDFVLQEVGRRNEVSAARLPDFSLLCDRLLPFRRQVRNLTIRPYVHQIRRDNGMVTEAQVPRSYGRSGSTAREYLLTPCLSLVDAAGSFARTTAINRDSKSAPHRNPLGIGDYFIRVVD